MAQITNGNNREVFDIAESALRYIFKNGNKLEIRIENGEKKYIIDRKLIIELFFVDRIKHESNFEIFNLNEIYSKEGNSLHYNVLESVKQLGVINDEVFKLLEKYGHEKNDVLKSLNILEDRTNSLIVPLRTNESIKGERNIVMVTEYGITKKGEKYLEMIDLDDEWQCYRDVIGLPGKSIKELL